jgi:hypothetical protein
MKQELKKYTEGSRMATTRGALLPTSGNAANASMAANAAVGGGLKSAANHLMHSIDDSGENADRDMKRAAKSAKIVRTARDGGMAVDEDRPAECNQS